MKNFLKLLMLLMLALALVLAFVGCFENPEGTTATTDGSGSDGSEESTGASCEGLPVDGDHSFVMVSVSVEPSCTEKGEGLYRCSECGIEKTDEIAARGHEMGDWAVVSEPTYNEAGLERAECVDCDYFEEREIEKLVAPFYVTMDLGGGEVSVHGVSADGVYSLEIPEKIGYNFVRWIDEDGNEFPAEGTVTKDVTITAVWELDGTDTLEELIERAAAGVDRIKITADITVNEPIFFIGSTHLYSDDNYTIKRDVNYDGDIFVIGQDKDGFFSPVLQTTTVLTLGGGKGTVTVDGSKDTVEVNVVGSALFVADATVNLYDGFNIANNIKLGNQRILSLSAFVSEVVMDRAGGAAMFIVSGVVNMYGGVIENNIVATEPRIEVAEDGTETHYETAGCGGAIYNRGNFNMYGGVIRNSESYRGGAIYNDEIVNMVSGTVSYNKSHSYGGAISSSSSAEAQMFIGSEGESESKMVFEGNHSIKAGGVLYSNTNSPIVIYGNAEFRSNTTESSGGVVYTGGALTIRNSLFVNNSCIYSGGALYLHHSTNDRERRHVEITNCIFDGNSSSLGGAIVVSAAAGVTEGAYVNVNGCVFKNNESVANESQAGSGGAVYVTRNSYAEFVGCEFTENKATGNAGALSVHSNATVKVEKCTFDGNSATAGGALYTSTDVSLSLKEVKFNNNKAIRNENGGGGNGGAIYASLVKIELDAVEFIGNSAENNGGAFYMSAISATLNESVTVKNNSAGNHGGAIYATYVNNEDETKSGSNLTLSGITFENNTAKLSGGAISARTESILTLNNVSFIGNSTPDAKVSTGEGGGAIYVNNSTLKMTDVTLDGNLSGYYGGAIKADECSIEINGAVLTNNSGGTGGAIFATGGSFKADKLTVKNNTSTLNGVIYFSKNNVTLTNLEASENEAVSGGVIYTGSLTKLSLSDSKLTSNTAGKGGAICIAGESEVHVGKTAFESNSATGHGGAIYTFGAHLYLESGATFTKNSSERYGGAVHVTYYSYTPTVPEGENVTEPEAIVICSTLSIESTDFSENTALRGGALYVSTTEYSVKSTAFTKNSATDTEYGGGAIYNTSAVSVINNVTFAENTSHKGGAVALHSNSQMSATDVVAKNNSATVNESQSLGHGGAFYVNNSTLALNGSATKPVSLEGNSAALGGAIHITTGSLELSGVIFKSNTATSNGGAIVSVASVVKSDENTSFENNGAAGHGGAIYLSYQTTSGVQVGSTLIVNGSTFTENTAISGGAISGRTNSDITLTGATLISNTTISATSKFGEGGGAIYVNNSTLTVSGSTLDGNKSGYYGGAIRCDEAVVTLENNTQIKNSEGATGAAVYVGYDSTLTVENAVISDNLSSASGVLYVTNSKATLSGLTMENNTAANGGAIYASADAELIIESSAFRGNSATGGGAIYVTESKLLADNVIFEANKATANGGAIYSKASEVVIDSTEGSVLSGNSAAEHGGAIYLTYVRSTDNETGVTTTIGSKITVKGAVFENNSALSGGAISARTGSETVLDGVVLRGNSATDEGGAIYVNNNTLSLIDTTINGNHSGIFVSDATLNVSGSVIVKENTNGNVILGEKGMITVNGELASDASIGATFEGNRAFVKADGATVTSISEYVDRFFSDSGELVYVDQNGNIAKGLEISEQPDAFNRFTVKLNTDAAVNYTWYTWVNGALGEAVAGNTSATLSGAQEMVEYVCQIEYNGFILVTEPVIYAAEKTHPVCGESCECSDATHEDVTFTPITNLEDFKTAMTLGGSYYLATDIALNKQVGVKADVNLCLNGKKLTKSGSGAHSLMSVSAGVTLTLSDCGEAERVGYIDPVSGLWVEGVYEGDGEAVKYSLFGGVICGGNTDNGGAIYVSGTLNLYNVNFAGNNATKNGGAVYLNGAALNVYGDTNFIGNAAAGHAGAIYVTYVRDVSNGAVVMSGGSFAYNRAMGGGAVSIRTNCSATFTDTVFLNNSAFDNVEDGVDGDGEGGGAIYQGYGSLTLTDVTMTGNSAEIHGGAIQSVKGTVNISGGTFSGNVAAVGGAISSIKGSEIVVNGAVLSGNSSNYVQVSDAYNSDMGGGAIAIFEGTLTLTGVTLENNSTGYYGGALLASKSTVVINGNSVISKNIGGTGAAIYLKGGSKATLESISISENVASANGVIYISGSSVAMTSVTASNNSASNGGVVYISTNGELNVIESVFTKNKATSNGGAIFADRAEVTVEGGSFSENTAKLGGAILVRMATLEINSTDFDNNEATSNGGAIVVQGSEVTVSGDSSFNSNKATGHAGAIYVTYFDEEIGGETHETVTHYGSLNMTDGSFEGNTAMGGGAVSIRTNCSATFTGTEFINNSVIDNVGDSVDGDGEGGGAIYVGYGSLTLTDVTMTGNRAEMFGGAVNVVESTVTVIGGEFKNNSAARGGAVNIIDNPKKIHTVSFTNTKFTENHASGEGNTEGGGAINAEYGELILSGVTMDGNSSVNYGGAVNARKGRVEIKDNSLIINSKGNTGAALYFREAGTEVIITGITVSNTTAEYNGAIYMTSSGSMTVNGLTAIGNTANQGSVFYVSGGADVTVNGLVAKSNSSKGSGGVMFVSGANMTVNDSTIGTSVSGESNVAGNHGGFMYAEKSAVVTLNRVGVVGNSATGNAGNGGAIYVTMSTLRITDSTFESNSANQYGGAIDAVSSDVTISGEGTLFKNNSSVKHGGAIYLSYTTVKVEENGVEVDKIVNTTFTMTDGRFEENTSLMGGAVSARDNCTVTFTGTEFIRNSATAKQADGQGGGAIYASNNVLTLSGVLMDGNSTVYYGGAIATNNTTLTLTDGCVIKNSTGATGVAIDLRGNGGNTATINGLTLTDNIGNGSGVIYATNNVILKVSALSASGNKANNGGVFYTSGSASITIENSQISANIATTSGGAIDHRSSGKLTVKNTTFTSNTAGAFGGAITANGTGAVEIIDCIFNENQALATKSADSAVSKISRGGGAIFVSSKASVTVSGGSFTSNSAAGTSDVITSGSEMTDAGGAIMVDGGILSVSGATFSKNTANNGGAISTSRSSATQMNIMNCSFTENLVENNGAAIYIQNGVANDKIVIDGCSFKDNTATVKTGSSVYVRTSSSATIKNVTSSGGTDKYGDAFYFTGGAKVTLGGTVSVSGDKFYVTGSGTVATVEYTTEEEKTAWQSVITAVSSGAVSYVDASAQQ